MRQTIRSLTMDRHGTVVGFDRDDVIVRWDTGLEAALAPHSLAPTD
jgi:hypothetical protein